MKVELLNDGPVTIVIEKWKMGPGTKLRNFVPGPILLKKRSFVENL
jgi:hypothetical protein